MPTFDITTQRTARRWAATTIDGVSGQPGVGFFRLSFQLTLHVTPADAADSETLTALCAEVRSGPGLLGLLEAQPQVLPLRQMDYSHDWSLALIMDLDRARLEAIEAIRAGHDLQLALQIYSQTVMANGDGGWRNAQASYTVSQSAWAQVLEQMGYRKTMLIEVPVFHGMSHELSAAATDLAKAQAALQRGDYREAVGHCRDVMEQIKRALKDDENASFENQRDKSKADRLSLLRRSYTVFTHPARHRDEVSAVIEWNRVDAVFAISVASAILSELAAGSMPR